MQNILWPNYNIIPHFTVVLVWYLPFHKKTLLSLSVLSNALLFPNNVTDICFVVQTAEPNMVETCPKHIAALPRVQWLERLSWWLKRPCRPIDSVIKS